MLSNVNILLKHYTSLKIGPIDPVNRVKNSGSLKARAIQAMNDLMDKLLIKLFVGEAVPFVDRGIVYHDDPP